MEPPLERTTDFQPEETRAFEISIVPLSTPPEFNAGSTCIIVGGLSPIEALKKSKSVVVSSEFKAS